MKLRHAETSKCIEALQSMLQMKVEKKLRRSDLLRRWYELILENKEDLADLTKFGNNQ